MPSPHSHPLLLRVWIADALRHFWPHERAFHMDDWWGFGFSASIFSCSCFAFISFNCALRTCSYCLSASSFRPRSLSLSAIKGRSLRSEPISSKQRPQNSRSSDGVDQFSHVSNTNLQMHPQPMAATVAATTIDTTADPDLRLDMVNGDI